MLDFQLHSYFYELPEEYIAKFPCQKRDNARLLIYKRNFPLEDKFFFDLPEYIPNNSLIIVNNTKVLPTRILGKRSGGGKLEFLPLTPLPHIIKDSAQSDLGKAWQKATVTALLKPSAKIHLRERLNLGQNLQIVPLQKQKFGQHLIELHWQGNLVDIFMQQGVLPLPPYLRRSSQKLDSDRYQTVYASQPGAIAAPTAGLHFTPELKTKLLQKGIEWQEITLHTGYGTFSPVRCTDIRQHQMHSEYVEISASVAEIINKAIEEKRPIIAVGTTSLRAVEGVFQKCARIREFKGLIDIFIYPGKQIHIINGLITNFHLPESTLLMLVSALIGRENLLNVYQHAIDQKYRFFSYGDAMFIL